MALDLSIEAALVDRRRAQGLTQAALARATGVSLRSLQRLEAGDRGVALALRRNASPLHVHASLRAFFGALVLCVALRNGDAHLKNFGLLFTDPTTDDAMWAAMRRELEAAATTLTPGH